MSPDYPELTPYQFASNSPVSRIDLDGLESWLPEEVEQVVDKVKTAYEVAMTVAKAVQLIRNEVAEYQENLNETVNHSEDPQDVAMALGKEFVTGLGPTEREFGEEHIFTKSLMSSRTTRIALVQWLEGFNEYTEGERPDMPPYYAVSWPDVSSSFPFVHLNETGPIRELIEDGGFTTSQFTGSAIYLFDFDVESETLSITVNDNKTVRSLMFHLVDDRHSRDEFPLLGKTYQTYNFDLSLQEILNIVTEEVSEPAHHGMGTSAGRTPNYPKE